jgi:phage terminase small subunit
MVQGVPLRERRARFAGHFVQSRNPEEAYRLAFVVDKTTTASMVLSEAEKLLRDPDVRREVQELRDTAAAQTLVSIRDLLQDWHDIATADPNELVSVVADCCRFCHGIDHKYQWADIAEWAKGCDAALAAKMNPPSDEGGYGYDAGAEPAPSCPACFGRGYTHVVVHDTRRLSPRARKLYKSAKETKNGIEVSMHDQQAARESLAKVLGAFKVDGSTLVVQPAAQGVAIPETATPESASKAYLKLVSSR